ncbi:glycosyltransferase [Salsipaludibacter albus]|uniref:glycosyltransferase n=1 Tax=Salsipaludibacter albus TaxID=2849650 RepID=UPI001EE3A37E|nr:glycosyltransferase [Salsipaludibacter albus]
MSGIDLSVVVPTYRGADALPSLVAELDAARATLGLGAIELLLVNDGSPDDTEAVLDRLAEQHDWVHGIDLLRNHGQPVATMCGLAHARGALVATMDDDLQHPPDQLPLLVDELRRRPELDAVVGSWTRDEGLFRDAGSWLHGIADRLAHGTPKGFRHSAFRVIRRPVVEAMVAHQTRTPVVGPLLTQVTTRIDNVDVRHDDRTIGTSNFRTAHGVRAVVTNFIQGSTLPLRVMSGFGLATAAVAVLAGVVFAARALWGADTPPGWLSTFLATVFFGGAILFQIGLVGQYIHVIVREVRGAPRWTIRRTTDDPPLATDQPPLAPGSSEPPPPGAAEARPAATSDRG